MSCQFLQKKIDAEISWLVDHKMWAINNVTTNK